MYMKKITFLFAAILMNFGYAQTFYDAQAGLPQITYSMSAWGDYDNDGDLDLFISGYLNSNTPGAGGLYEYDNGAFTLVTNSGLPLYDNGEADWGDFDGDGNLDLLIMGYDEVNFVGVVDVFRSNGNGTFAAMNLGMLPSYLGDTRFADINNDGHLDIAVTGIETNTWANFTKIYKNNGNNTVSEITTVFPPLNMAKIAFADYDADGDQDFAISGWNNTTDTPYTALWKNNGDETFTEITTSFANVWLGDLGWADYDNDGDADLLVTGTASAASEIYLYRNEGSDTFTEESRTGFIGAHRDGNIEWADFDNDGNVDLYVTGVNVDASGTETAKALLYINNGNSTFTLNASVLLEPQFFGDVDAADYDADGKVDLVVTGSDRQGFGISMVYHNGPLAGIRDNIADNFKVYPNPASDFITISNSEANDFTIQIMDITGKIVKVENVNIASTTLDVSNLNKGVYLLKIIQDSQSLVQKLIIK